MTVMGTPWHYLHLNFSRSNVGLFIDFRQTEERRKTFYCYSNFRASEQTQQFGVPVAAGSPADALDADRRPLASHVCNLRRAGDFNKHTATNSSSVAFYCGNILGRRFRSARARRNQRLVQMGSSPSVWEPSIRSAGSSIPISLRLFKPIQTLARFAWIA